MLTLNDGRAELWQWDTGRTLAVDADCSQVHFSNKVFGRSIDVDVADGTAIIPDVLLQTDNDLNVWAFVGTAENGYTKISKTFKVNRRNKPADYVFTPHDQTTLGEIVQRLEELEAMQDPDAIRDAVDEYLANNPIEVEETDPTVPDWAKQPEPPKVEIPEVNIPTTLPNPHPLTFTGAVEATYDGSKAVEVAIPQGGGGEWELLREFDFDAETARVEITDNISDISEIVVVLKNTGTEKFVFGWLVHGVNDKRVATIAGVQLDANKSYFSHLYLAPICYAISAQGTSDAFAGGGKATYISSLPTIDAVNSLERYTFSAGFGSTAHGWIYCKRKGG